MLEKMQKINLREIALQAKTVRKGKLAVFRPIRSSLGSQDLLEKEIKAVLQKGKRAAISHVLPSAYALKSELAIDSIPLFSSAISFLKKVLKDAVIVFAASYALQIIFGKEERSFTKKFSQEVKRTSGIDLESLLLQEDLKDHMDLFIQKTVSLIAGLTDDVAKRVETALIDGIMKGLSNVAIAKLLTDAFGWGYKRARLIARDQLASWNSELNRIRQQQLGIKEYIWSTSMDERVRGRPKDEGGKYPYAKPSHWAREGNLFQWAAAPEGGHPGEPISCRCVARAKIRF